VLLPLFTVVGMDRCEEDVNIVCGRYLLVEEEKRKKRKYWTHKVFRAREDGEFHTLFGRLKDDRQKFFKYFRRIFSKFENLKQLLDRDSEKKNTRWRRSVGTEERMTLPLRLVHKYV
jgi:hypothetical protein